MTVYTVGTIKDIPGVRTYVAVDGGMSDNPRPVLYGSGYEAFLPRAVDADRPLRARVVGKHCESGDVLLFDAAPARPTSPSATCSPCPSPAPTGTRWDRTTTRSPARRSCSSRDGAARLVVRRETFDDLLATDVGVTAPAYPDPMPRWLDAPRVCCAVSRRRSATPSATRAARRGASDRPTRPVDTGVRVEYTPALDGDPDPGEVVWTWVPYEEDPTLGKDRPVVIIGRHGRLLSGVALTTKHGGRADHVEVGTGPWDSQGRPSYAKVDRLLDIDPAEVRREGAILGRRRFDAVIEAVDRLPRRGTLSPRRPPRGPRRSSPAR